MHTEVGISLVYTLMSKQSWKYMGDLSWTFTVGSEFSLFYLVEFWFDDKPKKEKKDV